MHVYVFYAFSHFLFNYMLYCNSTIYSHFWKWRFLNLLNKCCRRERDHSEAERAQHIKQMRDVQEHIQEKERQLIELQEQVCIFAFMVCTSVVILK
jgi:hypothetical protein